jgi:sugar O-acyltransferase (sialic acid O-acetyltransferase NeuD family)
VADHPVDDARAALAALTSAGAAPATGATRKAELLLARHGLTVEDARAHAGGGRVTEEAANAAIAARRTEDARRGFRTVERIGIIGGGSGGGALIVIDSLMRSGQARAIAVFDRDPALHGREILGVPVVGDSSLAAHWCQEGRIDAVVIAFNRDLAQRQATFEALEREGARFCNVIDSTAELRTGVALGRGNVILGRAYIGACASMCDNNFISGGVWLEHGNRLGSHCAFGPGVATSGNVTIGDRVRFGTGIFVEPGIGIGDDAVLASGAIVTDHVPPGRVLRVDYAQSLHPSSKRAR